MSTSKQHLILLCVITLAGCATSSVSDRDCVSDNGCRTVSSGGFHAGRCDPDCQRIDDFCVEAVPAQPGTYVNSWLGAMRREATENDLVMPRNQWFRGGAEPGPEGSQHIQQLAWRLIGQPGDVIVETEPVQPLYEETLAEATSRTHELNLARRTVVIDTLLAAGVADAELRVHLSPIEHLGTRGLESPQVFNQLFQGGGQGRGQNGRGGGFGGGGGAFGGGGNRQGF